jgi:ribosomal protein S18 acetylase RimI-like enzyme
MTTPTTYDCRPVQPPEVVPALRLILGQDGQPAEESQARELMKYTAQRGINLADIWVARSGDRVYWSALPVVSPGRTVLYFGTSATLVGLDQTPMDQGIEAISRHFAERDIQMAQVLLEPADQATVAVYLRHEFQQMAELLYLQKSIRRAVMPAALPGEFQLLRYNEQTHAAFGQAILSSYENSLDCPALNGTRGIEDILSGHKAAGIFDPADWFVLLHGQQPVAVLMLCVTHQNDGMELVYLGLSPAVRGYGLGNYLMQVAEARVCEKKLDKLSLAVDGANTPALRLYDRHGMKQVTSKVAMMRMLVESAECKVQSAK